MIKVHIFYHRLTKVNLWSVPAPSICSAALLTFPHAEVKAVASSLSDASGKRSLNSCIAPSNKMLNHMYSLDDYNIMTWHANLNNVK